MHKTKPFDNNIHLIHHEDGIVYTFRNITTATKYLWYLSQYTIGSHFRGPTTSTTYRIKDKEIRKLIHHDSEYILRDGFGTVLTYKDIYDYWFDNIYKQPQRRTYCFGRRLRYCGYRHIKTFQERKWAHAWDNEEFAPKARSKRQGKSLPDPWDDYIRNTQRNWKSQNKRRYQWKEHK